MIPQVQEAVRKVLDDAGLSFREGMVALKANRGADSGVAFDKSVEIFLMSTLDVQRNKDLHSCYNQLIETVYRIEFPNNAQPPQIRSLSATCQWKWNDADMKLADEVATISKTLKPVASTVATTANVLANPQTPGAMSGFTEQGFEPSPRDELARLELTSEEFSESASFSITSWQGISNRTGVSVAELLAANPGMREPRGRVFVPVSGNSIDGIRYSRPSSIYSPPNVRIVRAQAGDTISKLASRNNADPTEVAKYNGLMPNSVLGAGREIKIPQIKARNAGTQQITLIPIPKHGSGPLSADVSPATPIGPKPQMTGRNVAVVMKYFNEVLHDPYSMRIMRWSRVSPSSFGRIPCWQVSVKYRAKNLMGAYVLSERIFYIRNHKIISTSEM